MRTANFQEEIRKRGKLVITLVIIGFRKTGLAVRKYTLVLAYFFGLSLFLFREVLVREGVVAFEDLAPFFSQTQFHEFQFSSWVKYTQGIPFRARPMLLFLWPRYLPLLRPSLVLITTLGGLLFFFSTIIVFKLILKGKVEKRHFALAIISSTYALFILLPAKLSHFNTLVLGAAFMCLALSFFIKALLETALVKSLVLTFAAAALLLMTPSIEQVVLFYAGISFLVFISILLNGKLKKTLSLFAIIFLVHAAPYLVYIFFVTGSGIMPEIFKAVYTSYEFIKGGSVNPLRFASSAHSSQISRYLTGGWAPPVSIMFLFQAGFCMLSLIKFRKSKTVQMIFSLYLLAFFFALGFKSPISGYVVILKLSELIPFLKPIARAILFQVLRNPQRWLFLETYVRMVLFGLSAITVLDFMKTKLHIFFGWGLAKRSLTIAKKFSYILIVLFMVSSFLVYPYNLVFTGDFGGALKPANVPQGMEDIKKIIKNSNSSGKIISFPFIGRGTVEWNGLRPFLSDEFYNFYFETPSIEGVSGVSTLNQLSMFFGYHLMYYNRSSSIGRYFSLLGVKYIFFHNDVTQDSLADESRRILYSLESQTDLILRYQNEEYYLFEVMNQGVNARSLAESKSLIFFYDTLWTPWSFLSEFNLTSQDAVFVDLVSGDTSWSQFNSIVERIGNSTAIFLPGVYFEDVVLSLLLKEKGVLVKPSFLDLLEFEKNGWVVPPARYPRYFGYLDEYGVYGEFGATDDVYIASSKQNVVATFKFDVPKKDTYNIYVKLHAPDGAMVLLDVDGISDRIEINNTATYDFVQIFEGNLNKGRHKVSIKKLDKRPLVINLVYLIGSEQFSNYANEFSDLINNRHILMSDKYSDIVDHVSKLSYPRNLTIYYYNGDLYSKNLAFRVKDEIYTPIKAVYSGSLLIFDEMSSSGDVEPIHLPDEKVIRLATLAYVTYIALLWVGLGLVVMRLRHRLHVR
ncbi:MAG: hypothetical protein ACE5I5_14320 [Candidatus Heimdallarchaeota archaeon]